MLIAINEAAPQLLFTSATSARTYTYIILISFIHSYTSLQQLHPQLVYTYIKLQNLYF